METIEDKIWDAITNSAKSQFDYTLFKADFPFDPEMIIFMIVIGFASEKPKEIIKLELFNNMLMTGFKWNEMDINEFLKDKEELFKLEINACKIARKFLDYGTDPIKIYDLIKELL